MSNIRIIPTRYRSTLSMRKVRTDETGKDFIDESVNKMVYTPDGGGLANTTYHRSIFVYILCDEKIQKGDWFMVNGEDDPKFCVGIEDGKSVGIDGEIIYSEYENDSSVRLYHPPNTVRKIKYTNDTQNCKNVEKVSDLQMKSIVKDYNK